MADERKAGQIDHLDRTDPKLVSVDVRPSAVIERRASSPRPTMSLLRKTRIATKIGWVREASRNKTRLTQKPRFA